MKKTIVSLKEFWEGDSKLAWIVNIIGMIILWILIILIWWCIFKLIKWGLLK